MAKSLCIYCASSNEVDNQYKQTAYEAGRWCALNGWHLIYGAGSEGLMGAACDGCQAEGGKVTGVIPQWMADRGWMRQGIDETIIVDTMAERKQMFRDRCDAILVLPGGYGTMEEFFETVTDKQMGRFHKPIVILNQDGFYDHLIEWMRQIREKRFLRHDSDLSLWVSIQSINQLGNIINHN